LKESLGETCNPSQLAQNKFRGQYPQSVLQLYFTGSKTCESLPLSGESWLNPVRENGLILNRE